jgi:alanine-synthesizing transaminase
MFSKRTAWRLQPNRLAQTLDQRKKSGLPIFDLTESNPTRCGLSPDSQSILEALNDPRSLAYEPDPRGVLEARRAVSDYYMERGAAIDPQNIFLTTSTSESYSYLFRLLADPGDNVLVPQPSYPLFDFLGGLNDLDLVPYSLLYDHGWQIDLASFQSRFTARTRAILVVHPNNPTGSFMQPSELGALTEFCQARGCALIVDEVFADYAHDPAGPLLRTLAGASQTLTFTLSGLSKIAALPQMKLGWIVVNGPEREKAEACARLEVIADTYLSVSAALGYALPKWIELRHSIQPRILARVRGHLAQLDRCLAQQRLITRFVTEGGWYAILKLPAVRSDEEWAIELLRQDGVYVHPGHFFDMPSEGHLVISLLPESQAFEAGIRKLTARVAKNC